MSALGEAEGTKPGGTWPAEADARAAVGHVRAHNGRAKLRTLFYDVVGTGVLTSHFWVSYEAGIGFMVGKDIGSNTRREVNGEVTCEQERVGSCAYRAPLTQGITGSPF